VAVLEVSCAVRGDYVPHSAAMLHSVLGAAGGHRVRVHYLHGPGLAPWTRRRLARMVQAGGGEVAFHRIAARRVAGLPVSGYFTEAMWYRILLPELLPGSDRVLYLDADTIACDAIAPLWDEDLDGLLVGAVTNVFEERFLDRPAALGLAGPEAYFNSGVLLLNLDEMRRAGAAAAIRAVAAERGDELLWPDQDALNIVLGGRRRALHPRWNAMNSVLLFDSAAGVFGAEAVAEARARPAIRHFEGPGPNKPWSPGSAVPQRERYLEHRRATPWPLRP
jgi:lipopolysaccharide biosynthesis glycosyltransferase